MSMTNTDDKTSSWVLVLLVYFLGCVVNYNITKQIYQKQFPEVPWTKDRRASCIAFSAFSWIAVMGHGIHWIATYKFSNEKADW